MSVPVPDPLVRSASATIVAEANASISDETHCIQEVTPMTAEREALGLDSAVGEPECFDTEAEALAAVANVGGGGGARYGFYTWYSIYEIWTYEDFLGSSHLFYNTTGCSGYFWSWSPVVRGSQWVSPGHAVSLRRAARTHGMHAGCEI